MLRVGIIGLPKIAEAHIEAIVSIPELSVAAVADLDEGRRAAYMSRYDIPAGFASHFELLEEPSLDAVAVTVGHHLHHRVTVDACRAAKHVMVEKPMALTVGQCDDMIAAAADSGVKLMVGMTQHFQGPAIKAKEILDSGELGPLVTATSYMSKPWGLARRRPQYRSRYHGGGMWLTNGVHVVDRLNWLMGAQAVSVAANIGTRSHYQAADDAATAFIRYKNGLAGVAVAVGYADGAPITECQVICTNGSLRFSGDEETGFVQIGKGGEWQDVPFDVPATRMANQWGAFAAAILQDIEPPTHGAWGRHVMEVLLAAEQSAISGREVLLSSGDNWLPQTSGVPVTSDHGWI